MPQRMAVGRSSSAQSVALVYKVQRVMVAVGQTRAPRSRPGYRLPSVRSKKALAESEVKKSRPVALAGSRLMAG